MDNPELPVNEPPRGGSHRGLHPALLLLAGLVVGVIPTILIINSAGGREKRQPPVASKSELDVSSSSYQADNSAGEENLPEVSKDKSAPSVPPRDVQAEQYAADRGPGSQPPPASPAPPPLPGGSIGGGTTPPLTPVVVVGEQPTGPEVAHSDFVSVTSGAEFEAELQRAIGAIRSAGGNVILQFAHDPDRPESGTEIFASIDNASADKLKSALRAVSAHEVASWAGRNAERAGRMQRGLRDERGKAAQELQELQIKYMDDATQVIVAKERLARYDKALSALGGVQDTKTTFRITIGRPR